MPTPETHTPPPIPPEAYGGSPAYLPPQPDVTIRPDTAWYMGTPSPEATPGSHEAITIEPDIISLRGLYLSLHGNAREKLTAAAAWTSERLRDTTEKTRERFHKLGSFITEKQVEYKHKRANKKVVNEDRKLDRKIKRTSHKVDKLAKKRDAVANRSAVRNVRPEFGDYLVNLVDEAARITDLTPGKSKSYNRVEPITPEEKALNEAVERRLHKGSRHNAQKRRMDARFGAGTGKYARRKSHQARNSAINQALHDYDEGRITFGQREARIREANETSIWKMNARQRRSGKRVDRHTNAASKIADSVNKGVDEKLQKVEDKQQKAAEKLRDLRNQRAARRTPPTRTVTGTGTLPGIPGEVDRYGRPIKGTGTVPPIPPISTPSVPPIPGDIKTFVDTPTIPETQPDTVKDKDPGAGEPRHPDAGERRAPKNALSDTDKEKFADLITEDVLQKLLDNRDAAVNSAHIDYKISKNLQAGIKNIPDDEYFRMIREETDKSIAKHLDIDVADIGTNKRGTLKVERYIRDELKRIAVERREAAREAREAAQAARKAAAEAKPDAPSPYL